MAQTYIQVLPEHLEGLFLDVQEPTNETPYYVKTIYRDQLVCFHCSNKAEDKDRALKALSNLGDKLVVIDLEARHDHPNWMHPDEIQKLLNNPREGKNLYILFFGEVRKVLWETCIQSSIFFTTIPEMNLFSSRAIEAGHPDGFIAVKDRAMISYSTRFIKW